MSSGIDDCAKQPKRRADEPARNQQDVLADHDCGQLPRRFRVGIAGSHAGGDGKLRESVDRDRHGSGLGCSLTVAHNQGKL